MKRQVFGATYAAAYDALYAQKDYEGECDFIVACLEKFGRAPAQRILDLGCGTGGHLILLAQRGYRMHGVDRSRPMLAAARRKAKRCRLGGRVSLEQGDIQHFAAAKPFDAAICMFAVIGYQTSNEGLFSTLRAVRQSLRPGGLFVCDFWYGPAVLADPPTERIKVCETGKDRLVRITTPQLRSDANTVDVTFRLMELRGRRLTAETVETHSMRFFFRPEFEFFLTQAGMELVHLCEFPALDRGASERTWNVAAIARAI